MSAALNTIPQVPCTGLAFSFLPLMFHIKNLIDKMDQAEHLYDTN